MAVVTSVAVDPVRGTVWVFGGGVLSAFSPGGTLDVSIPIAGDDDQVEAAVDPLDGSVWVAVGKDLWHYDRAGVELFYDRLNRRVTAMAPSLVSRSP